METLKALDLVPLNISPGNIMLAKNGIVEND